MSMAFIRLYGEKLMLGYLLLKTETRWIFVLSGRYWRVGPYCVGKPVALARTGTTVTTPFRNIDMDDVCGRHCHQSNSCPPG